MDKDTTSDGPEPDLTQMSDRELLLSLHTELRGIKRRLGEGDRRFARIEGNQTMLVGWAREIALSRQADHVVAQIDAHLESA